MRNSLPALLTLPLVGVVMGCAGSTELPTPRSVIVPTGYRVAAQPELMEEVDVWVRRQMDNIDRDPSFLIVSDTREERVYPWETFSLSASGDTAHIAFQGSTPDAQTPFLIYAHFHLMAERGELEAWLPEAEGTSGYTLERAILDRIADVWLYGRSIFDASPHPPLDEILYAREFGYLDALILTLRPEEFPEERAAWLDGDPGREAEFRAWFEDTFERAVDDVDAAVGQP